MAAAKKAVGKKAVVKKSVEIETRHVGIDWRSIYLYAICLITLLDPMLQKYQQPLTGRE